jgi:hypothetical protein
MRFGIGSVTWYAVVGRGSRLPMQRKQQLITQDEMLPSLKT